MKFVGFPSGRLRVTPLPDLFFSELLAQIDDLAELKLTLHVLWRLAHHKSPLCVNLSELRADAVLRQSLSGASLEDALTRAVGRGTLIELHTRSKAAIVEHWYFANTAAGRREAAQVRERKLRLSTADVIVPPPTPAERPNIFALYEQYVGMLTPLIAEQLHDAAQTYSPQWIEEAFTIAARQDKRNWRYVEAILQRWAREGKGDAQTRVRRAARAQPSLKPQRQRLKG